MPSDQPQLSGGTAVFREDHGECLWRGLRPRASLEQQGVNLPKGFHAVNDSTRTRALVFEELRAQKPRIDATLLKENSYDYIRSAALRDVCAQMKRESVLCVWDAGTSWGLQIADYALWAIQRRADGGAGTWWDDYVRASTASTFFPWGATTPMSWS